MSDTQMSSAAAATSTSGSCSSPRRARRPRSSSARADVSEIWHGRGLGTEGHEPGPAPDRQSYGSFASFSDPDGNRYLLQEITQRLPGRE